MSTRGPNQIGAYEIVATLARGGMGIVYLARRNGMAGFRRLFAVKQLHALLAADPACVAMFVDEARLAARIHHPNVVPVIDLCDSDDGYFVVMDYIEGASVSRLDWFARRANRPVPVAVALRIVLDALAGLHAAHELAGDDGQPLSLVHRDVSPQNILVGTDGVARLIDFGIARAEVARAHQSISGIVKGKPAYMAPEQIQGAALDRRADVYAMGIVLCEMLSGPSLFDKVAPTDRLCPAFVRKRVAQRLADAHVPPELRAVCTIALQHDPERRFATAAAFAHAVRLAAAVHGVRGIATPEEVADCLSGVLARSLEHIRTAIRAVPHVPETAAPIVDLVDLAGEEEMTARDSPPLPSLAGLMWPRPPSARRSRLLAGILGAALLILASASMLHVARSVASDATARLEQRAAATGATSASTASATSAPQASDTPNAIATAILDASAAPLTIQAPSLRDRSAPRTSSLARAPAARAPAAGVTDNPDPSGTAAFGGRL